MKEPAPRRDPAEKPSRDRFVSLGSRIMAVSKEELEKRAKAWRSRRKRKNND